MCYGLACFCWMFAFWPVWLGCFGECGLGVVICLCWWDLVFGGPVG